MLLWGCGKNFGIKREKKEGWCGHFLYLYYPSNRYRIALNRKIKEKYNSKNQKQIKEVYDDILYPAFQNSDERLKNIKTGILKKH
jgi:hypothetical protein